MVTNFGKDMTDKFKKKNACKNAYLGSIFIPEKYVFRVCFESPFMRTISSLKYKWPPGVLRIWPTGCGMLSQFSHHSIIATTKWQTNRNKPTNRQRAGQTDRQISRMHFLTLPTALSTICLKSSVESLSKSSSFMSNFSFSSSMIALCFSITLFWGKSPVPS